MSKSKMAKPKFNMDDWEVIKENPETGKKKTFDMSDWEKVEPSSDESALDKLPRNIGAGIAQGVHELLNTPSDVAKNIESQGKQFGEMVNKALPLDKYGVKAPKVNFSLANQIPRQKDYNFAQMLGQKGEPTFADTSIQKVAQYAPEALIGINALKDVIPHLTRKGASKKLRQAKQLGIDRNMGPLNVDPQLIEDMRQFLPNTAPYRNAIDAAHTGDYQKLFELQSDVGKESAARAKDWFSSAQRSHGHAGFKSVNALLDDMHKEIQAKGHLDISDLLSEGRNDYRRYSKFKPYKNAIIGSTLGALGAYSLPKNALTKLVAKVADIYHQ